MTYKCPTIVKDQLVKQCKGLGLFVGDTVMVHASLRAVGEILGGPDVLIGAILESIGSVGNMMMYVGCQMPFDDVGRGIYTADEEAFIMANLPMFEPHKARAARPFGALAELFRTTHGAVSSQNPSCRMTAIGSRADWIAADHPLYYGFGQNTPLEKLCNIGGKVMLIGSSLDEVTLLHYAEAIAPIPNKKIVKIKVPVLHYGKMEWLEIEEFNSSTGIKDWPDDYFAQIVQQFIDSTNPRTGQIGNATTYVLDAKKLVDFAIPLMVEKAKQLDG